MMAVLNELSFFCTDNVFGNNLTICFFSVFCSSPITSIQLDFQSLFDKPLVGRNNGWTFNGLCCPCLHFVILWLLVLSYESNEETGCKFWFSKRNTSAGLFSFQSFISLTTRLSAKLPFMYFITFSIIHLDSGSTLLHK